MFVVDKALKISEEDNYEEGCLPDSSIMTDVDLSFKKDTIEELIEELKIYYGEYFDVDPCEDDPSRIDFCRTEDANGTEANELQREKWKAGNLKLWYVTYTMNIKKAESVNLAAYNLKSKV